MKANNVILAAAIFVATTMTFVAVSKDSNAAFGGGGRYQALPDSHSGAGGLWIVDTETGKREFCFRPSAGYLNKRCVRLEYID